MDNTQYIIDRVIRLAYQNKATKAVEIMLNQISNPQLKATMDTTEVKDALDVTIAEIGRAKSMEMSADNALFDLGLYAKQTGGDIEESSSSVTFNTPYIDELTLGSGLTATTAHTPVGTGATGIPFLYLLNNDGTVKEKYAYAASASATEFTWATSGSTTTVTAPTGLVAGNKVVVIYEYLADNTNQVARVVNKAMNFPAGGIVTMEVLFRSVCNKEEKYHGFVYFGNGQLDGNFDVTLGPDSKHPFTIKALKDYCSENQDLCTFYIPQATV